MGERCWIPSARFIHDLDCSSSRQNCFHPNHQILIFWPDAFRSLSPWPSEVVSARTWQETWAIAYCRGSHLCNVHIARPRSRKLEEIVELDNTKALTPPDRSRMSTALSPSNSHQNFTKNSTSKTCLAFWRCGNVCRNCCNKTSVRLHDQAITCTGETSLRDQQILGSFMYLHLYHEMNLRNIAPERIFSRGIRVMTCEKHKSH